MVKVLIADDDKAILDLLHIYMRNEGYDCLLANNGQEALETIQLHPEIDIALLDIMMPEKSGMEVLEWMRDENVDIPVIFISANQTQTDKISGLLAGADDYVTKPFEPLEVVARVKSLLRRQGVNAHTLAKKNSKDTINLGAITIDLKAHQVMTSAGKEIKVTGLEYEILQLLAGERGKVWSAEDILENIWKDSQSSSTKTVMVHVSNLRNKIEEATGGEKVIQTVWGVGYKIEE
ncbi:response regulator transcription factor [Facklamia miroungae]|uniref:DNA-binding response regulator, OmpR family, contains REC and winged-helix (WHTH) domain n=1 Tax=Facklamia miroungae TaxID=120956 RepID=A0A1G7T016_9LACT|nr:response regulator transcription factor [Facklamia miroungae]NKZ29464.1 response regulator transcription factor [Facklamia miroungae]SDG28663.1 DNA-binding response regulator, OmpR family, contains REC and winged-helix (wHTH) domain [Facklamia miroungae]